MKLYAKVNSERAEKGQGGNQFLDVHFYFEDKTSIIGTVTLKPDGRLVFLSCDGQGRGEAVADELVLWQIIDAKAKRQKSESIINICKRCNKNYPSNGRDYCPLCMAIMQ